MVLFNAAAFCLTVLFAYGAVKPASKTGRALSRLSLPFSTDDSRLRYNILLAALFLIALLVRVYGFTRIPPGLNQDEAMAAVDANALALYGTDHHGMPFPVYLTAWGSSQMNLLESLLMIPFIKVMGLSVLSARLPMLLVSLVSVFVLWDFSARVFGRRAALAVTFFAAINPWHIMISRWALESNLFPAFLLFSIYFLYRGLEEKRAFLYLSMAFFGLCMYAYGIAYFTVPVLLLALVVKLLLDRTIRIKEAALCALVYFVVALPIFLMMAVNYFKLPSIELGFMTIPYFPAQGRFADMIFFGGDIIEQGRENLLALIKNLTQMPDAPWNLIPEHGTYYVFSFPLLILGIRDAARNSGANGNLYRGAGVLLVCFWFAAALYAGLSVNRIGTNQINILFFPLLIFCGLGLQSVCRWQEGRVALPAAALYAVAFALFLGSYFGGYRNYIAPSFYQGFSQSIEFAERSGRERLYITNYTQARGMRQVSEILTLFHAKIDPLYFQNKKNLTRGGAALLPYGERYVYVNFDDSGADFSDANAVYVFNRDEAELFSEADFTVA
ncbi:MAG: glycosyltransferase family 39 protein, partial [Clostridiales bacterium]|nr:glycosyltransferase family 39 protein [Clostridiales bacterium]